MADSLTPMMRQYQSIRSGLPEGAILLFRLGDFYEMFFDDAVKASAILNVALTKRQQTPMCGVPFHAAEGYIAKLVKAGKRVAICDQVGEPQPGRIVERRLTQVISPGTVGDLNLLDAKRNNFLAAIFLDEGIYGFAYVDLSTGEFRITELSGEAELEDEMARVGPAEVLVAASQADFFAHVANTLPCDDYAFALEQAYFTLRDHFAVQSLDGFGCRNMERAIGAAGAILHYLKNQLHRQTRHISRMICYRNTAFLTIDAATQANLELAAPRGARDCSLLTALDRTATPMGGRRLRDWVLHPLQQIEPLRERQEMIAAFLSRAVRARRGARHPEVGAGHRADRWAAEPGRGERARSAGPLPIPRTNPDSQDAARGGRARGPDIPSGRGPARVRSARRPDAVGDRRGRPHFDEGRRHLPARIQRRPRRAPRGPRGWQGLDRPAPAARDSGHRHQIPEGPLHLRVRLFHRGHEEQPRRTFRPITSANRPP